MILKIVFNFVAGRLKFSKHAWESPFNHYFKYFQEQYLFQFFSGKSEVLSLLGNNFIEEMLINFEFQEIYGMKVYYQIRNE